MTEEQIKVLLVEDNAGDARLVKEMLNEAKTSRFLLTSTEKLEEALKVLSRDSFDIIILDLQLPNSHGLDTFKEINGACPDTPILVLSGLLDEELAMEAVHEGAQDYLVKGQIDSSLLERSIRYAIQRKRAEAALLKKERKTALLAEASKLFNSSLKTEEIFDKLAKLISEEIADACSIFTINNDNHPSLITAFRKGKKDAKRFEVLRKNPPTLEGSVAGACIRNREPVLVKDTYQDERFSYYYRDTFGVKSYICVPLISRNEVLGVISTSIDSEGRSFDEDDLRFVVSIADRAAPALENARLYEKARARAQRLSVVNEISKTVTSSLTFDKVYDTIVEQLKRVIPFEFSMNIALYNPEDDTFSFSHAYDPLSTWDDFLIVGRHYKPHQLTLSKAFDTKQTLYVPDTRTMDAEYWSYLNKKSVLSLLHIPLIVEEKCIGTINISAPGIDAFKQGEIELLETVTSHLAIAINNAKFYEKLQKTNREMAFMNDVMELLIKPFNISHVLGAALDRALDFMGLHEGVIYLLDETGEKLQIFANSRLAEDYLKELEPISVKDTFIGQTMRRGESRYGSDFSTHITVPAAIKRGYKGFAVVPIKCKGEILGALVVTSTTKETVSKNDVRLLEALGAQIGVALENSNLYERIMRAAEKLKKREHDAVLLSEASRILNSSLDTEEIFEKIAKMVSKEVGDTCSIFKHTEGANLSLITAFNRGRRDDKRLKLLTEHPPPMEDSVVGRCVRDREPALIADAIEDERINPFYRETFNLQSYICVPLISRNTVLGAISTSIVSEGRRFDESDLKLVVVLADRAAQALENSYLYEKEMEQARRLSVVSEISRAVTSSLDIESVYGTILQRLKRILPFEFIMNFALYRPEDDSFIFSSTYDPTGVLERLVTVNHSYPADSLMLTKAFREKTTLIQDLTKEAPPQYQIRKAHAEKGLKLIINVPLMVEQQCMGTFNIGTFDVNDISKDEIELLETLSSHLAIAINNAKMYEELQNESRQRKHAQEEVKLSLNKLRKTLDGTIQVLASTVEARDPYTAGHQRRVADLARAIATEMNLSQEQIDGIRMAGVIHDIGKLTVPIEILSKPGKLSEIEFNLIKTHPQVGYDIVKDIELPEQVIKMVLHHHERMDGSGYPQGLAGEDIIIEARVLAVADVIEAMASHRPYRPALGVDKALEEITRNSGTHYDPLVVEACLSCITRKGYVLTPAPAKVKPILRAQA